MEHNLLSKIKNEVNKYVEKLTDLHTIIIIHQQTNTEESTFSGYAHLEKQKSGLCLASIAINYSYKNNKGNIEDFKIISFAFPSKQKLKYEICNGLISASTCVVESSFTYLNAIPENQEKIKKCFKETLDTWDNLENKHKENLNKIKELLKEDIYDYSYNN